ncbi:MAG: hypothetical protein NTW99_01295 [Chloroflexi bacterium]|nr:hypothetical protein [Chloroflexota bacterium]
MNLLNPVPAALATVALSFVPMALQRSGVEVVLIRMSLRVLLRAVVL